MKIDIFLLDLMSLWSYKNCLSYRLDGINSSSQTLPSSYSKSVNINLTEDALKLLLYIEYRTCA